METYFQAILYSYRDFIPCSNKRDVFGRDFIAKGLESCERRDRTSRGKFLRDTCIDGGALKFTSRWKEGKPSYPLFPRRHLCVSIVVYYIPRGVVYRKKKKISPFLPSVVSSLDVRRTNGEIWNKALSNKRFAPLDVNCKTRSSRGINSREIIKYTGAVCKKLRRTSGAYSPRSFQAIFPQRESGSLPISRDL